jgi:hypothetical protein
MSLFDLRLVGAMVCVGLGAAAIGLAPAHAQRNDLPEPRVRPAVPGIIDALEDHRLIAIGEVHRNEQVHDVLVAVVRDTAFLPGGGDVVVEWGNARYQSVMDRYITGERVSRPELVPVWRETVNILVWDAPVYERLFATIREVNARRPSGRRLRVVLADPPIDWAAIRDQASWERIAAARDRYAAGVVEREVLARGHHALLIFGSGHVQRERAFDRFGEPGRPRQPNLADLLESRHPGATLFVLADWMTPQLDARLARWRAPALARLQGTWLGNVSVGPPTDTPRLEDLGDAFLYLGPTSSITTSMPRPEIYCNTTYLRELKRRDAIQGGANTAELQRLGAKCRDGGNRSAVR